MKTFEDCLAASLEIMYKDQERIEELEKTISDLCKTIRSIPYGWCGIEQVEKAEKVLKNEN